MRHLRRDYDGIQDANNKIPVDEPVFIIRAKDMSAPGAIEAYAQVAKALGASERFVSTIKEYALAVETWQQDHKSIVKVPDVPDDMWRDPWEVVEDL